MNKFMASKLNKIFDDFKKDVDKNTSLCNLKDLNFEGGNLPDYNNPFIQRLYLLRYFPAYLSEYYLMYKKLLAKEFITTPIYVISIGAGCCLDYYGLHFAAMSNNSQLLYTYTGVDAVDWMYKQKLSKDDKAKFINMNISEMTHLDNNRYNVIVFPKSIGEFNDNEFIHIKQLFGNLSAKRLCVLSSLRHDPICLKKDRKRVDDLVDNLCRRNQYKLYEPVEQVQPDDNDYIGRVVKEFDYDSKIKTYLLNLLSLCYNYRNNGKSCKDDCAKNLNRNPILKTTYIKYIIVCLEKEITGQR